MKAYFIKETRKDGSTCIFDSGVSRKMSGYITLGMAQGAIKCRGRWSDITALSKTKFIIKNHNVYRKDKNKSWSECWTKEDVTLDIVEVELWP